LVNKIAGSLVEEFNEVGVDIVATACGQCKRMIQNAIKAKKSKINVMDMAELVLAAGISIRNPKSKI
jgi:Fe-S oxidoreductase